VLEAWFPKVNVEIDETRRHDLPRSF